MKRVSTSPIVTIVVPAANNDITGIVVKGNVRRKTDFRKDTRILPSSRVYFPLHARAAGWRKPDEEEDADERGKRTRDPTRFASV